MRKILYGTLAAIIILAGCAPNFQKQEEVVQGQKDSEEKAIIPKYKISDEYYRTILPFKPSESRGLVVNNLNTRYDITEFETGLMRVAQTTFDPDKYLFQEGQYLKKETVSKWLQRKYTDKQFKEMMKKNKNLKESDNIGLNPIDDGKGSLDERNEKNPIYLAHILEHNYLIKGENDKVSLGGVAIGLALNSVHYYKDEQFGNTFDTEISHNVVEQKGKEIAQEVINRMRAMDGLKDVPIVIALFEQQSRTSVVPGNFFAYTTVSAGSSKINNWKSMNEKYVLFPSSEAKEQHRDDLTAFSNFKQDVEKYFPNFNGVIGKAFYVGGNLQNLRIEIPIQFYGKTEAIGFTQFVTGKVMEHFPNYIAVEVNVSSVYGPEALIIKEADQKEPFVHIYH